MGDLELLANWTRLEGALVRFTEYLKVMAGPSESYTESLGRLGLAAHAKLLLLEAYDLAEQAGILDQFVRLFSDEDRANLSGTGSVEHSLGAIVLLTGFVEGHVKALTLQARITEEAEAYARERVKSETIGFRTQD